MNAIFTYVGTAKGLGVESAGAAYDMSVSCAVFPSLASSISATEFSIYITKQNYLSESQIFPWTKSSNVATKYSGSSGSSVKMSHPSPFHASTVQL